MTAVDVVASALTRVADRADPPVAFVRAQVLHTAAGTVTVTVGGLLLVVDDASVPPWTWADLDTHFPPPQHVLGSLELPSAQWRPERLHAARRRAIGSGGQQAIVTDNIVDNVIVVRRLSP